jgi:threonine/homoserine/homoserine lactone efflux protein
MADVVKGEININDNTFVDGVVTVVRHAASTPFLGLFVLFTFLIAIMTACAIFVLVLAFFRRRRRRRPGSSYTIIVHPHI